MKNKREEKARKDIPAGIYSYNLMLKSTKTANQLLDKNEMEEIGFQINDLLECEQVPDFKKIPHKIQSELKKKLETIRETWNSFRGADDMQQLNLKAELAADINDLYNLLEDYNPKKDSFWPNYPRDAEPNFSQDL